MRKFLITAGLCLAASAATAGADAITPNGNMTLSNGCVYAPSPSGQSSTWALVYANTGPAASCAFRVQTRATDVTRAQAANMSFAATSRVSIAPDYMVGVFR